MLAPGLTSSSPLHTFVACRRLCTFGKSWRAEKVVRPGHLGAVNSWPLVTSVPMTGAAIDRHRSFRGAGFGGTMSDCQAEVWIPVADPAGWNLQEAAWDDGSSVTQWQKILSSCFGPISYRTFAAIIPGNIKVIVSFVQR